MCTLVGPDELSNRLLTPAVLKLATTLKPLALIPPVQAPGPSPVQTCKTYLPEVIPVTPETPAESSANRPDEVYSSVNGVFRPSSSVKASAACARAV